MSGRHFFATAADLLPGFTRFEQACAVRYVETGHFDARTAPEYRSGTQIPDLGLAASGRPTSSFLVVGSTTPIIFREIHLRAGGIKFAVDQLENADSTVFWPGGLWNSDVLIAGRIATTGVTNTAKELQRVMVRTLTRGFRRVGAFWLGSEALSMFEAGARLTADAQMPREYDLRRQTAG
jgi:hypothetical protein